MRGMRRRDLTDGQKKLLLGIAALAAVILCALAREVLRMAVLP